MMHAMPDPLDALRPLVAGIAGLDHADRVRRGAALLSRAPRPPVGLTPHRIIHRQNKLCVRFYAPSGESTGVPVVVVPSMINKAWICDLEPDRSLVGGLAERGHPVYLVDWGVPGDEDAGQTVADTLRLLQRSIDRACRHAGAPQALLLGYCQGGTLATLLTALHPERVRGLSCFNTPVHFAHGGRFRRFVDASHLDVEAAFPADRLVPVALMRAAFQLLDPMGVWQKHLALERVADDPTRLRRSLARERWLEENVPMPGAFAQEFIAKTYQEDALMSGSWVVGGRRVDLSSITCPVQVTASSRDPIAPPASVLPLAELVGSDDVTVETLDTGHIGIVVGSFGPRVFFPRLDRWLRAHT
jgi:polyhydroxyalkanoate synthase